MSVVSCAEIAPIVSIIDSLNMKAGGDLAISEVADQDVDIVMTVENLHLFQLTVVCAVSEPGYHRRRHCRHMAQESDGVSWMLEIFVF